MAKKTSPNQKARYTTYGKDQTWKVNRQAKLERHLKENPEDQIAIAALKKLQGETKPRRAKYVSGRVTVDGVIVRSSGRLVRELARVVKGALNEAMFRAKAEAEVKK